MIDFYKVGDIYITCIEEGESYSYQATATVPKRTFHSIVYELRGEGEHQEDPFPIRITCEKDDKVLVHCPYFLDKDELVNPIRQDGMWTLEISVPDWHLQIQVEDLEDEASISEITTVVTDSDSSQVEKNSTSCSRKSVQADCENDMKHEVDEVSLEGYDEEEEECVGGQITSNRKTATPSRYRAARSDAKIASIRQSIEVAFGLPEGSVELCGPDGRPLRGDALIRTLRRRWEDS